MKKLAIVIPFFKADFFHQTLLSIKNQNNQHFQLYIGNDDSPHDPADLINDVFADKMIVRYQKFDNNLGSQHLTKHWERCISMTSEPYIWLFSDDDIMPPDAVERFYRFIESQPEAELIKFDLNIIDQNDNVINLGTPNPKHETSHSFITRRLQGKCISAACEYIFTKEVYERHGGFVDLPVGWASDDATWLKFGAAKGIYTIQGTPVWWRFGNGSISSSTKNQAAKTKACLLFVKFVRANTNVSEQLLLNWLLLQTAVLNYAAPMKVRFFYDLIKSGMFGSISVFHFFMIKAMKRVSRLLSR